MEKKDITLYTASTMNGWKPIIILEEADLDYNCIHIHFSKKEQKAKEYLQLNPNGKIPTLVDHSNDDFVLIESGAILWYLAEKYSLFLPTNANEKSEVLQWLMFQMSGIGPMMGQAMYFQRIAKPQGNVEEYSITRYINESRRLLEVLDTRLEGREYIVGKDYSIADIALYPWIKSYYWANVSIDGLDHLASWLERIDKREKTQKALTIPEPFPAFFGKGDVSGSESLNASRFKI